MIYKFVSFKPDSRGIDGTMTILAYWRPFPWFFCEEKTKELQFHGGSTVWHKLPSFRRPGVFMESLLADYKAKWDYEKIETNR